MWQEVIVGVIVVGAFLYVGNRYLPHPWKKKKGVGCGSGDDGCSSCGSNSAGGCSTGGKATPSAAPSSSSSERPMHRVIKLHPQR